MKQRNRIKNKRLVNKPGARILKYNRLGIADAKGVSIFAVRKAVQRDILDPNSLKSVANYICGRVKKG